jgi:hypothetical protein
MNLLLEFGGVYFDSDVVWTSAIPDTLLGYQFFIGPDWPRYGEWPETFNSGVLMAQAHAPWLRHYLQSLRYFRDEQHVFNSVMMTYRVYERHPDMLYLDYHLQVNKQTNKNIYGKTIQ